MSNYQKVMRVDNHCFLQEMDLSTDTAFYRDIHGKLLMSVDSSGYCTDVDGKPSGKFSMRWPAETWYYESADGTTVIDTDRKMLFDHAEPAVIAKLFADVLSDSL